MMEDLPAVTIGNKKIGDGWPCFIIAEAGVNHNGSISRAKQLIDAAHIAGADAVKFQLFKAENLVIPTAEKADYQKRNDPTSPTQYQMLKNLELSDDDCKKLAGYAKKKGIIFLSTAFDEDSLELLIQLDVPAFKIPSGEITNIPALKKIAQQKKPVILSTGMSTLDEVRDSVVCLREHGCTDIILLHCTTSYPAPLESVHLRAMDTLRNVFRCPVGYSDHTEGILVPAAAVARGSCIVEKHLTLDRTLPGPDHAASLEPDELREMVTAIRNIERALGKAGKRPEPCEIKNRDIVRKSVVIADDIPKGSVIKKTMLTLKRPGTGIPPRDLPNIIGKKAKTNLKKNTLLTQEMIE